MEAYTPLIISLKFNFKAYCVGGSKVPLSSTIRRKADQGEGNTHIQDVVIGQCKYCSATLAP